MNNEDNEKGPDEDESPEEMVNRRLAEALDDQQRYMDMFQTSSHMLQILSRFIADPIRIHDLEAASENDTRSSSPSSSSSSSPSPSSSDDEETRCIRIAADWNNPSVSCRIVETNKVTLDIQPDGRPLSHRNRTTRSARQQPHATPLAICSVQEKDKANEKDKNEDKKEDKKEEAKTSQQTQRNADPCGAGDCQRDATTTMTDTDETKDCIQENASSNQQKYGEVESTSSNQLFRSRQTQASGPVSKSITGSGESAHTTVNLDRAVAGRTPIGVCTQVNINETMVEISKAADTIRQARAMLSSFNQRLQMNNNYGEPSNLDGNDGRSQSDQQIGDTDVDRSEQVPSNMEGSKSMTDVESSGRPRPILVKPAADSDQVSNDQSGACSQTQTLQIARDKSAGNGVTLVLPQAGEPISRTSSSNNSSRNLVVSGIGGSSGPASSAWSNHFARLTNTGNIASNNNQLISTRGHVSQFDGSNSESSAMTNIRIKLKEETKVDAFYRPIKKRESVSNQFTLTLEAFKTALKLAIQNIEKEKTSTATNGNKNSIPRTKVDSNNFVLPVIDTPVVPFIPENVGLSSGGVLREESTAICKDRIKQDIDVPDSGCEGNIDTESISYDHTSNTYSIQSTTVVQPFIDSSEDMHCEKTPVANDIRDENAHQFKNTKSGEIIVVHDVDDTCSFTPIRTIDLDSQSLKTHQEEENLTAAGGDVGETEGNSSCAVTNDIGDGVKQPKARGGFLRRLGATIRGFFKKNREVLD